MKPNSRSDSRKADWKHAKRKRAIVISVTGKDLYDNLHQYSKNKISCSSAKKGENAWGNGANSSSCLKITDQKKLLAMKRRIAEEAAEEDDVLFAG